MCSESDLESGRWGAAPTCTGSPVTANWANALKSAVTESTAGFAGFKDWRLPNIRELISIVEEKCTSPSINSKFPTTAPASVFWSSSAYAYLADSAWVVSFDNGGAGSGTKSFLNQVRLVRGGEAYGRFDSYDTVAITVVKTGTGAVSGGPINCGAICTSTAGKDFSVILTASPPENLIAWGGDCVSAGGNPTCTVTMNSAKTVSASFVDTSVVTLLPTALTFTAQNIGSTSAAQSVKLTNTGTALMTISGLVTSGDFARTTTCGSTLTVGANCTISVTCMPTAAGPRYGTLTLSSNAPGSPHFIPLTCTGLGAVVSLDATSKNFASLAMVSSSAAQDVILTNTGGLPLSISSILPSGDFALTPNCPISPATLAQAAKCTISITFKPTVTGARSGSVIITSNAVSSPDAISLSGTSLAAPLVTFKPTSLTFDDQHLGSTSPEQTIVLSNTGAVALNITNIASSMTEFAVISSSSCFPSLLAGSSCNLTVKFKPITAGTRLGAIRVTSNAAGSPHSAIVSGVGIATSIPICTLSASPPWIRKKGSSILSASCSPAVTSYSWTGGTCAGTSASSCTVSPTMTTIYSVTGSNADGSDIASAQVTVRPVDLTPILMLLLLD